MVALGSACSWLDEFAKVIRENDDRQGANHLYSVAALTDNSGAVVERYRYSAYGERTVLAADGVTTRTGSLYGNQVGFTGRYLDKETGLWYFRARYYSGSLGRFVSRNGYLRIVGPQYGWSGKKPAAVSLINVRRPVQGGEYLDGTAYNAPFAYRGRVDPSGYPEPEAGTDQAFSLGFSIWDRRLIPVFESGSEGDGNCCTKIFDYGVNIYNELKFGYEFVDSGLFAMSNVKVSPLSGASLNLVLPLSTGPNAIAHVDLTTLLPGAQAGISYYFTERLLIDSTIRYDILEQRTEYKCKVGYKFDWLRVGSLEIETFLGYDLIIEPGPNGDDLEGGQQWTGGASWGWRF